ncbi:MAG: hypothetical protein ACREWI_05515 [Telluria sp.]
MNVTRPAEEADESVEHVEPASTFNVYPLLGIFLILLAAGLTYGCLFLVL